MKKIAIISLFAFGAFALSGVFPRASAALGPRSPENLEKSATLIITGVATEVTTSSTREKYSDWIATIEARVGTVKKGLAKAGETIKIRCWQPKKRPDHWAGRAGHFGIPAKGSRFKMWLRKDDDGVWVPLEPNGIDLREGDKAHTFKEAKKPGFFRRLFGSG